jgi:hypothetical protein
MLEVESFSKAGKWVDESERFAGFPFVQNINIYIGDRENNPNASGMEALVKWTSP